MIKKILFGLLALAFIIITTGCSVEAYQPAQAAGNEDLTAGPAQGPAPAAIVGSTVSQGYGQGRQTTLAAAGELSEEEAAGLLFMFEEEKLAHDVYLKLYEQWGTTIFQNIANSESTHMQAIQYLLERYGLGIPDTLQVGVFTDPDLQALYTELIVRGSLSLAEALKVGGAIEEIDILDLQERLAQTNNADIQRVYNSLLRGSTNHLSAFANALFNQSGETYQPQFMSLEEYQAIVSGFSRGSAGRSQSGQGSQGGQGFRGGQGSTP